MDQKIDLIKAITPLYNSYKQNKGKIKGRDALLIMWDIGDLLKTYIEDNKIAPHNLFRQIYGKSEGKKDVEQKSYITREFQGRCFRIRNIFTTKEEIDKKLHNLLDFTTFREAMPFFDNPIYELNQDEFEKLLRLLNSKNKSSEIVANLDLWKKSINNISNSRTQKLNELVAEKEVFIAFYNLVYRSLKLSSYDESLTAIGIRDTEYLNLLSKNISALAQEGILNFEMNEPNTNIAVTDTFISMLIKLLSKKDEKERRRFRRLVSPERTIRLSEMIYSLTTEKQFLKRKVSI
jgi:hypothetical protein